jgi:two-component system, OmpR family, phosphate regulon sensor histidine kinase PhoR
VTERDLERKARVAELLLEAARELSESLDPERVYDRFHVLLANVIEHDGVVVSSYDARDELIRCDWAWSDGERLDSSIFPALPLNRRGGGMQSRVIISGEALLFNDVSDQVRDPGGTYFDVDREGTLRRLPDSGPPGTRAAMMVPVKQDGRVVGVVQVMSNTAGYSTDELELVEGLVGQMAAAVRNARLQRERRRLEAAEAAALAVAAEREQAASVLEAVGDGIFLVDGEGVVKLWNRAAALITGIHPDRARGRAVVDLFPKWDELSGRIPVADDGSAAKAATVPVEVDGAELWLSFMAVRSADGIVYAFRDLTAERRLEEQQSDFIATVSHELRTPMAAVHGAAQTLLHRHAELTARQNRELVEMIATQAARLGQITEEVLLATQLDRGKLTVAHERVDVGDLARATLDAMRPQLNGVVIDLEVAPGTCAAAGAPDRIQQVLLNLLDNAVKYAAGPFTVRVEATDGVIRLSVADSGPGLTLAEQERIFEKFYRAGPQLTRPSGGTGLGLYISRELVQLMGGRLDVRSQPGEGATFVVELPLAAESSTHRTLDAPEGIPRPAART